MHLKLLNRDETHWNHQLRQNYMISFYKTVMILSRTGKTISKQWNSNLKVEKDHLLRKQLVRLKDQLKKFLIQWNEIILFKVTFQNFQTELQNEFHKTILQSISLTLHMLDQQLPQNQNKTGLLNSFDLPSCKSNN